MKGIKRSTNAKHGQVLTEQGKLCADLIEEARKMGRTRSVIRQMTRKSEGATERERERERLSGMFRRSASLAIPHHKSFAAIPSLSLGSLGTRIAALNCHTNRSVKLPSFRHFQDQFLTTNKEKWGKKTGLCFARFVFLTFRRPLASHDSNPYPKRSRIARYNATKERERDGETMNNERMMA